MTLTDLYEPLFQYICMLNRISRKGDLENVEFQALRTTISGMLESIRRNAQSDPILSMHARKLDEPITFFVDSMLSESKLKCAPEWHRNRLAYANDELAGDEKFFDFLDATLEDPSPEATAQLQIYFICLGLGFMGWFASQPERLRQYLEQIGKRIGLVDAVARICPEAYQYLDTRNLIQPPGSRLGAIALAFLALLLVALLVDFYLFRLGSIGLRESLAEILKHDLARPH